MRRSGVSLRLWTLATIVFLVAVSIQGCGLFKPALTESTVVGECNKQLDGLIPSELTDVFPSSKADARINSFNTYGSDSCVARLDVYWSVGNVDGISWEDIWSRLKNSSDVLENIGDKAGKAVEETLASKGYDASIYLNCNAFLIDDKDCVYFVQDNSVFSWPYGNDDDMTKLVDHIESAPGSGTSGTTGAKSTSTCPRCGGSGKVKYWNVSNDLEAELLGPDAYDYGICTNCNGTGRI